MGNYAIRSIGDIVRISIFLHFVNKNIFVFTVINLVAVPACRVGHSGSYNKCLVSCLKPIFFRSLKNVVTTKLFNVLIVPGMGP